MVCIFFEKRKQNGEIFIQVLKKENKMGKFSFRQSQQELNAVLLSIGTL